MVMSLVNLGQAQIQHERRYQIEFDWKYDDHIVVPNEERGVTLMRMNIEFGKNYPLEFIHLDKDLKEVWRDTVEVSSRMYFTGYHYLKDKLYVLLQDRPVRKRIKVLRLDYKTKSITEFETTQIAELFPTEFEVIQNTAVLGGYFEDRPVVFAYDLIEDKVTALPGVYQNNSRLHEVRVNKDSLTFNVLVGNLDEKKDQTVVVNTYDYEGNLVRNYNLITKRDYSLIDGVSSSINDITQVVVGNYGYRSQTMPSGIYINYVDRTGEQSMQYINYAELDKFLVYMNPSRQAKTKANLPKIKEKGREPRYKLQAIARELRESGDRLILHAEYFRPIKGSQRIPGSDFNEFARDQFERDFSRGTNNEFLRRGDNLPGNFDFTHAYVLAMDLEGKLLWEDSFNLINRDNHPLEMNGNFQWVEDGDYMIFGHYEDKELTAKILDESAETEAFIGPLEVSEEFDKRDEIENSIEVLPWYDDLMLVVGVQIVRPKDKSKGADRVFFINGVKIRPQRN